MCLFCLFVAILLGGVHAPLRAAEFETVRISGHFVRLCSQIDVAPVLLPLRSAHLFLPPAQNVA